jgi:photosystem II stability/assembly factor-like uncharacterized protein
VHERRSSSLRRDAGGLIAWRSGTNGWQEVGRHFEDGIIDSIFGCAITPERVFVGVTHDGLYRTIDGGESWSKVLAGDIRSVTVDPTDDKVIYSGVEPVALYRSEDGGDHWQELTTLQEVPETARKNWWFPQPPHKGHIRNIFIHPDNTSIIYLCIEHGGIVRSLDRGKSWEDVSKGIDYLDIHVIANLPRPRHRQFAEANGSILRRHRAAFSPVTNPSKVGCAPRTVSPGITFTLARRLDLTS